MLSAFRDTSIFSEIRTKSKVIPNGFDVEFWEKLGSIKKEPHSFIAVFSNKQFVLKGGDLILRLSLRFPACNFYIAGCNKPANSEDEHDNIHFLGKLKPEKLRQYYSQCQFHFQLSIFEGFGCALAEAMLCECIPIVSSANILPEIIGDTGFVHQHKTLDTLDVIIRKALSIQDKDKWGKAARARIKNNYNIARREKEFITLIES